MFVFFMQRQFFFIKMIYYEYVLAKSDPDEGIRYKIYHNMMPGKICILHTYYNSYKFFDKYGHVVYKKKMN